ncbi:hypothetical protein [Jiangella alkaliphila]|uniref:hypothetical protein n=1 Tax=Jiangella alkaliphila TaxID=419479 RepID=UPI000699D45E
MANSSDYQLCLGALVTGGIVDYSTEGRGYALPAEHALCLTGGGSSDLSPMSRMVTHLGTHVDQLSEIFRNEAGSRTRSAARTSPRSWTACPAGCSTIS